MILPTWYTYNTISNSKRNADVELGRSCQGAKLLKIRTGNSVVPVLLKLEGKPFSTNLIAFLADFDPTQYSYEYDIKNLQFHD